MTGDILVACTRCGVVYVAEELLKWDQDDHAIRELPAGGEFLTASCRVCEKSNSYRVLVGPLHVPRPKPERGNDDLG